VKYWYDTQAWLPKNAVVANRAAFTSLDKAAQAGSPEGSRGRGDPRLGPVGGKKRLVPGAVEEQGDVHRAADRHVQGGTAEAGDTLLQGLAEEGGAEGKAVVDEFRK
jgi:hypothetical protein